MKNSRLIAVALSASMLAACQQGSPGIMNGGGLNKTDVGTVGGAVAGGFLGSTIGRGYGQAAAAVGGALLGGYLGHEIGQSLDNADRAAYNETSQRALETAQPGQTLPWRGDNASGTVTPSNYYQNSNGQYCREYQQTVTVGGQTKRAYGKACRQPDGSWQIVE